MAGDWREISLGSSCSKIGSGATPRGGKESYLGGGTALIRSQNIYNDGFIRDGLVFIDDKQADDLGNVIVEEGDVLLNITGDSVARCCQVAADVLPARVNQHVAIIRPKPGTLDAKFLRYVLVSPLMQEHLLALASAGATRNALTKAMIESLSISAPHLLEQRAIAHILGTLDDKIELNRRMNATLEAVARALFKDWFVDFGPVRAKMEGHEPYLPREVWDLFPDRLVESELGEIPEGWETQSLSALLVIIGGGTPKTSVTEYWDGDIPWFSVVDTPATGDVFIIATEKSITEQGLAGSSARLIPKGTAIISARGTVGNLAIAGREMTFNQSCYGLRGAEGVGDYFVYLTAQQMVDQLKSMAHGSVFSTITRQTFEAIQRPVPPAAILRAFERSVAAWFEAILSNVEESRTLAQLRDTLLSKLISGELRVPAAQTQIEEFLT